MGTFPRKLFAEYTPNVLTVAVNTAVSWSFEENVFQKTKDTNFTKNYA